MTATLIKELYFLLPITYEARVGVGVRNFRYMPGRVMLVACMAYVRLVNIGALFDALNVLSGGHAFLSFSVKMVSLWLVITGMPPYPGSVSHILQTFVPFFFNEDCLCVCL